jgi:hypothetical protein
MNQEENETKSDKSKYGFEVFGLGEANGDAMVDVAMRLYLHPRNALDLATIQLMIERGNDLYYKNFKGDIRLDTGDTIITPAGFMVVSGRGTDSLVTAFTKILDEERRFGDLEKLAEKIRNEFFFVLGYFTILWELEDVLGSKTVKWSADKEETVKLIQKTIRFVSILLQEIETQIKEDLR